MHHPSLAIFASGSGSNAVNIIHHFQTQETVKIAFLLCNKAEAPVVERVNALSIPVVICTNEEAENGDFLIEICEKFKIDWIVLAGYLRKIPSDFVSKFPKRIVNIHPALLPKFGGAGMYGKHVHQAVLDANEPKTGITVHFVNEEYDKGEYIEQVSVSIEDCTSIDCIQQKIHALEMEHFPKILAALFQK